MKKNIHDEEDRIFGAYQARLQQKGLSDEVSADGLHYLGRFEYSGSDTWGAPTRRRRGEMGRGVREKARPGRADQRSERRRGLGYPRRARAEKWECRARTLNGTVLSQPAGGGSMGSCR